MSKFYYQPKLTKKDVFFLYYSNLKIIYKKEEDFKSSKECLKIRHKKLLKCKLFSVYPQNQDKF